LKSKSSVAALVARLKLAGYLESTPDRRLAPTRRFFARPLAETPVRAGLPDAVDDGEADALTIDDYLIERPSSTVLIRVKGDSMIDADFRRRSRGGSKSARPPSGAISSSRLSTTSSP
jgi:repressor LexA